MPDAIFAEPRLAAIYDVVDGDRSDLDAYLGIVEELGARHVLDVGCGTGTFACLLASRGTTVTAVDPAGASLAVARQKPGAERVRWLHGDATTLPGDIEAGLATMTGNVAQVFVDDGDWVATLAGIGAALRPGGWLVFETRDPSAQAWQRWTPEHTRRTVELPDGDAVEVHAELLDVAPPLVTFRWTYAFAGDGAVLTSSSTLRFRTEDEIRASLAAAGFDVVDLRRAPDRPGLELVFVARRRVGRLGPWRPTA